MTVKTADVNLEHAIRAGDVAVVTSLFSALSPADASKHRTAVLQLLKQMDATRFSDDKATLKRWGGAVTDAQWRAAQVAILFSGTARDIATHVDFDDELIALARQHPRPGFSGLGDALLDRSLFLIQPVQQLIVAGVIARPTSDNYAIALMGLPNRTSRGVPFEAYWKADPGLRSVLLRVLDVQGTSDMNLAAMDKYSHASRTWTQTLLNLIANGAYSRMEILERVLNTLESDWPQFRAGWFSRFHVELAPTIDELRVHRPRYQGLTASRIPPTVTLALDVLATLDADAPFTALEWTDALRPVMSSAVKAQVLAACRQMDRVVRRDPAAAPLMAELALTALAHPSADVQKAVLDRLKRWGLSDTQRAAAQPYVATLAAVHRPVAQTLFGEASTATTTGPQGAGASKPPPVDRVAPLDPDRRVDELHDLDALIERLAYVVEHSDDAEEFERVLAGLVRLGPISPALAPRFGPALKRAAKMVHPLARELARMLVFLHDGSRITGVPWRDENHGVTSTAEPFLIARVDALMPLAATGAHLTPLAAPTHRRGFIDPMTLVSRLVDHAAAGVEPSIVESEQALLRLAPGTSTDARWPTTPLPDWPVVRALRYALGEAVELRGDARLFAAAARIRHPGADDLHLLASQGDLGPDAARVARFEWSTAARSSGQYTFRDLHIRTQAVPDSSARSALVVARHARSTSTVAWLNERSPFSGAAPGMVPWSALLLPSDLEGFFAEGASMIGNNLDWWEAQWWTHAYLRPLLDPTVPTTRMAALLLSLGLCAKEPGQAALAIDALALRLRLSSDASASIGQTLRTLLTGQFILPSRLTKSLRAALRTDPSLDVPVFEALAEAVQATPTAPMKDLNKLLELLQETQLTSRRVLSETARAALGALEIGGRGATLRGALLASDSALREGS